MQIVKPLLLLAAFAALLTTSGCGFIAHAVVHDAIHHASEDQHHHHHDSYHGGDRQRGHRHR
jgi:hypothetical protein